MAFARALARSFSNCPSAFFWTGAVTRNAADSTNASMRDPPRGETAYSDHSLPRREDSRAFRFDRQYRRFGQPADGPAGESNLHPAATASEFAGLDTSRQPHIQPRRVAVRVPL